MSKPELKQKKTEDALRFSEARYRALFHDNPKGDQAKGQPSTSLFQRQARNDEK